MNLNKLLTCDIDNFHEEIDFIDGACNGIGLVNSLLRYMEELDGTSERNTSPIVGYLLQKLCDLNGISNTELYRQAYINLFEARLKVIK